MKRRSREDLERELRLSRKRTLKRLKRQRRRFRRRRSVVVYPRKASSAVVLQAPDVFDIGTESNRRELLRFLKRLREITVLDNRDVRISFRHTQRMVANGTLLFTAELHRINRLTEGKRRITCSYPKHNKVEQVLQQIGVLPLLGKPERLVPDADDVIHWRFIDGTMAEGEKANRLIEVFAEKLPSSLSRGLYNGLVEAMTNCVHHAYLESRGDGVTGKLEDGWWMFAQERETRLMVAFCDLGIGIPRSLPKTHDPTVLSGVLERVGRLLRVRGYRDADFVAAAFEVGKTRTAEPHRGFGLKEFREVIDNAREGTLRIFSNKAGYTYSLNIDDEPLEVRHEYNDSIFGTLIQWSLPLQADNE